MVNRDSFVQLLLNKQAMVEKIAEKTGKNTSAAKKEIDRQIRQAMQGKNPIQGEGVTKSGGDDGF